MQHLKPDISYRPQPDADAHLPDGDSSPPALILDFMYGAAAYRLWRSNGVHESLLTYYSNHYKNLLQHEPSQGPRAKNLSTTAAANHGTRISQGLLDAMDCLNTRLMMSYGVTPEGLAAQHQKQEDEKRLKEHETSRAKVMEWMGSASDASPVVPDV
ncbi:hypothetical protein BC826DRAFT_1044781 [Russula brevipes]|nr:hypothetical protein BC826DRAFT_1044781 [Russula brevipes]